MQRVNVIIPPALLKKSQKLVEEGYFANFSELVREGLRKEIQFYKDNPMSLSEDERKLLTLLKKADKKGLLHSEKELKKHGITLRAKTK